ncbi:unnamed protein product [Blepharisma stoltei]|uniref:Uncharacterized protein n=1 Tax=Blepharisma stoltei TaxID=1481888 RepID=A0AAU9IWK4_9CILI|nr:unnamed protein product [Blepharisma stoltei]
MKATDYEKVVKRNLSRDFQKYLIPTPPDSKKKQLKLEIEGKRKIDFSLHNSLLVGNEKKYQKSDSSPNLNLVKRMKKLEEEKKIIEKMIKNVGKDRKAQLSPKKCNLNLSKTDAIKENVEILRELYETADDEVQEQNEVQLKCQEKLNGINDAVKTVNDSLEKLYQSIICHKIFDSTHEKMTSFEYEKQFDLEILKDLGNIDCKRTKFHHKIYPKLNSLI